MARARNIKPGFFKNEVLAELPFEARLLFIGLWTLADREGRLEDRPKRIKAELFPFDGFDVDSMLSRLQSDQFLTRYTVDGARFIQIENFVKHQDPHYKEKASEIPAPEGRDNLILATGVTRSQRARILERDGYTCQGCGSKEHLCIDHILPVSRGGDSTDDNLQTLCLSCNTKKGNKLDGEDKNRKFRRDRPDFESKLSEHRSSSPSDSLSSDSLSSDSGFPLPDSPIQGESAGKPARRPPVPKPEDVTERTWMDWQQLRRAKRAPVTETVLDGARKEAGLAGLELEEFLQVWCRRGSQGLEAAWLRPEERGRARAPPAEPAWRTEQRQRTQQAAPGVASSAGRPFIDVDARQMVAPALTGNPQ